MNREQKLNDKIYKLLRKIRKRNYTLYQTTICQFAWALSQGRNSKECANEFNFYWQKLHE